MNELTKKKRKWIITQFRSGRSATSIAKIQKISRRYVYKLSTKYKKEGVSVYEGKKSGRPKLDVNPIFRSKVVKIRNEDDYGSEKIHFVMKKEGFSVSQHIIQRILDEEGLTEPCLKRRGQRKYIRYEWPISNYMWHVDWTCHKGKWRCAIIDDKSRKIMIAGEFDNATEDNAIFLLYQAILNYEVCPVIVLSDKGPQFYNSTPNKKGELPPSRFEIEVTEVLGVEFWTARRGHPQTNGKIEKWFGTMKKRAKKHPDESLQDFVRWYNKKRIHHALNYDTPEKVYWKKV